MEEPVETIRRHNGICPSCGRELSFNVDDITIAPVAPDVMKQYPKVSTSPFVTIQSTIAPPVKTLSGETARLLPNNLQDIAWLRRRNSLIEKSARYEKEANITNSQEASP